MLKFKKGEDAWKYQNIHSTVIVLISKKREYDGIFHLYHHLPGAKRLYFEKSTACNSLRNAIRKMKEKYDVVDIFDTETEWISYNGYMCKPKIK